MTIEPGDILAVRGRGFLSNGILRATGNTVSHVGLLMTVASPLTSSLTIEALSRVRSRSLGDAIFGAERAWVLSALNLTQAQRDEILLTASTFSADDYGYLDLALQLADAAFRTRWFTDRLASRFLNRWPICSFVVARAYEQVGLTFGFEDASLTPADVWEFAVKNPDKYRITQ